MELKKQSKEIYDQNEIQFNKLKKLKEDKDKIWKDYKKIGERIGKSKQNSKAEAEEKIPFVEEKITKLQEDLNELKKKKEEVKKVYNDSWKEYEEQQSLINYIQKAQKHKQYLQREKKFKEKEDKKKTKEVKEKTTDSVQVVKQEDIPYLWEISTCTWLINYFKNLTQKEKKSNVESIQNENNITNNKKEENSNLKVIDLTKREQLDIIQTKNAIDKSKTQPQPQTQTQTQNQPQPQIVKEKISNKKEIVKDLTKFINLDIGVINYIKDVNLNVPVERNQIEGFLQELQLKLDSYKKLSEVEKNKEFK